MSFNIEEITDKDIDIVIKYNATYGECSKAIDLVKKLKPKYDCNDELWQKMCLALYAYKLGEMQGKRAERAKKRKASVPVRNKMLSVLDEISNMSAEAQEIVNLEIDLNKKLDKLHEKQNKEYLSTVKDMLEEIQLKGGASNEC